MKSDQMYPAYLSYCSWRNIPWTEHNGIPFRSLIQWKGRGADGWGFLRVWKITDDGQMIEQDNDQMWEEYNAGRN